MTAIARRENKGPVRISETFHEGLGIDHQSPAEAWDKRFRIFYEFPNQPCSALLFTSLQVRLPMLDLLQNGWSL